MSINVQKLLDQIETRYNALDSNSTLSEIQRITELHARKDNAILTGAKQYASVGQATSPSGITDSANVGEIYFVADQGLDSSGRFFFRSLGGLINMKTATDSAENLSITAAASAAAEGDTLSAAPYQGSNFGYAMGGYPTRNTIEKYSYSSDGNTTDVGDMTQSKLYLAGSSSSAHGYAAGGQTGPTSSQNVIEKFTFPSDANAADVGDLTVPRSRLGGATGQTHGYGVAGNGPLSPNTPASYINTVDKYAYATDGNAADVGDITEIKYGLAMGTMASTENAYSAGGRLFSPSSTYSDVIDKWPLSTDTNASDVGDLTVGRGDIASAASSDTHGYASGGLDPTSPNPVSPFWQPTIDKWAFASDGNATSVGNITGPGTAGVRYRAGTQSTTHGYSHGGNPNVNVIEKFPFATDTDAADVGDLSSSGNGMTGAQY